MKESCKNVRSKVAGYVFTDEKIISILSLCCPNPPPVRGTTPPPPVMITRPLVTMPTIAPGSIHVITDTYKPNYEIGPSLKRKSMK